MAAEVVDVTVVAARSLFLMMHRVRSLDRVVRAGHYNIRGISERVLPEVGFLYDTIPAPTVVWPFVPIGTVTGMH